MLLALHKLDLHTKSKLIVGKVSAAAHLRSFSSTTSIIGFIICTAGDLKSVYVSRSVLFAFLNGMISSAIYTDDPAFENFGGVLTIQYFDIIFINTIHVILQNIFKITSFIYKL